MRHALVFALIASLSTSACGMFQQPKPVIQVEKVYLPDALLLDCPLAPPPQKAVYLASDFSGREKLLTDYSGALLDNLAECDIRLKKARDLNKGP